MNNRASTAAGVVGLVLHLALGVFPFAATGLVAPLWGYVAVYVFWFALLVIAVGLFRQGDGRWRVLLVPAAALVGWFAFISFGGAVLGWTA